MRVEFMRTYPGEAKQAFDYLNDFRTWPTWYSGLLEIIEPELAAWDQPGDKVRFVYRMLGRRLEGESTLEEVREADYVRFTAVAPMIGEVRQEWTYGEAGEGEFTLKVVCETDEPASFFGKAIDKMLIPRVVERDLKHTFDALTETFAVGIP